MKKLNKKQAVVIAAYFGIFQGLMPLIGWSVARYFQEYVIAFDHWVAFILLGFIGGKMIYESLQGETCEVIEVKDAPLHHKELAILAIATSIDALAVGIMFALREPPMLLTGIIPAVIIIGITTFVICIAGVVVGNIFGCKYKNKAEFAGGLILVLMGIKILLEDLGMLPF